MEAYCFKFSFKLEHLKKILCYTKHFIVLNDYQLPFVSFRFTQSIYHYNLEELEILEHNLLKLIPLGRTVVPVGIRNIKYLTL